MKTKRIILFCLICIELIFLGATVQLIKIGADYGLNKSWLCRKAGGLTPHCLAERPNVFFIIPTDITHHTAVVGPYNDAIDEQFGINRIISYSTYRDSMYVKYKKGTDTSVYRLEIDKENPSEYTHERVSDYPKNAVVIQIDGNTHLFYMVYWQKFVNYKILILLTIIICALGINIIRHRTRPATKA